MHLKYGNPGVLLRVHTYPPGLYLTAVPASPVLPPAASRIFPLCPGVPAHTGLFRYLSARSQSVPESPAFPVRRISIPGFFHCHRLSRAAEPLTSHTADLPAPVRLLSAAGSE